MKIVFMGTPDFALPTLRALHASPHEIQAVVTQPDRPKGRGRALQASPIKQYAVAHGLQVLQPEKASAPEFIDRLRALQPDLIIVIAYGQILKEPLLQVPKYFCMNIHASLLPKYRGAAPINWVLIQGEKETGVTTMKMDVGLDTGDILLRRKVTIGPADTAQTLHDTLAAAGAGLTLETLDRLAQNALQPIPQNDAESSYAAKLKKEDGWIRWDQPADAIQNRVRGLEPWPGAYGFLQGQRLRLCRVETAAGTAADQPGTVVRVSDYGIEVGTTDGRLIVTELQPEGKKRMSAGSFLLGHAVTVGAMFETAPQPKIN